MTTNYRFQNILPTGCLLLLATLLTGCISQQSAVNSVSNLASGISGKVSGGQQPISLATVQLYAVGTASDGSAAEAIAGASTTTAADGSFSFNTSYTCPTPTSLVYLLASEGNPGLPEPPPVNNTAITLIAALGQCQYLSSSTFILVNEVTTVAAVAALLPYYSSPTAIGSATSDASNLANAFTLAGEFASTTTGSAPGAPVSGYSVPVDLINTLADIVAACVNTSGGVANDGSACGDLFLYATPSGGSAPTETATALANIFNNPTSNLTNLWDLATPTSPFQPILSAPPSSWTVALTSSSGPTLATGDSRSVSQPTVPATCQTLSAQFTSSAVDVETPTTSDDTTRIQNALNSCENTGEAVELSASGLNNAFLAGELTIEAGESLVIDSAVTLYGNNSYNSDSEFIKISGSNTGIYGPGAIDGRANVFTFSNTPRLVQTNNASNFIAYNITLQNAAHPNLYIQGGNGATVWGVTINTSPNQANADGIDIDSITNVTVNDSNITAGDDGIAVKTNEAAASNITVENTNVYGTHGLSIGSQTFDGVTNVLFLNNYVYGQDSAGVASTDANAINIKTDEDCGGLVQQVTYENTCIKYAKHLIVVNAYYGSCSGTAGTPQFQNIVVDGAFSANSVSGAYEEFNGYSSSYLEQVYLANVDLDSTTQSSDEYANVYLSNSNVTPSGTGVTTESFTLSGGSPSVPSCSFQF